MAKKYLVEIAATAEVDIQSIHGYIASRNPPAAERWVAKVESLIAKLDRLPLVNEIIPEAEHGDIEYRRKLFGKYRIIYRIDGMRAIVLRVFTRPGCSICGCRCRSAETRTSKTPEPWAVAPTTATHLMAPSSGLTPPA